MILYIIFWLYIRYTGYYFDSINITKQTKLSSFINIIILGYNGGHMAECAIPAGFFKELNIHSFSQTKL